ncbi:hypothetical protein DLM75_01215 [Leptospira stimsonii]|uniref:Uncharacterized protein n=1 Tax=Leptospira stimsonii TaxID=2202203 RepID=A0A396Z8K1_9LEPT|nr:hypothetical protein DLM75_01215 [Leptospira stimsonii]
MSFISNLCYHCLLSFALAIHRFSIRFSVNRVSILKFNAKIKAGNRNEFHFVRAKFSNLKVYRVC